VLSAVSPSVGTVSLMLTNADIGCCPTVEAYSRASLRNDTIDAEYPSVA